MIEICPLFSYSQRVRDRSNAVQNAILQGQWARLMDQGIVLYNSLSEEYIIDVQLDVKPIEL